MEGCKGFNAACLKITQKMLYSRRNCECFPNVVEALLLDTCEADMRDLQDYPIRQLALTCTVILVQYSP